MKWTLGNKPYPEMVVVVVDIPQKTLRSTCLGIAQLGWDASAWQPQILATWANCEALMQVGFGAETLRIGKLRIWNKGGMSQN